MGKPKTSRRGNDRWAWGPKKVVPASRGEILSDIGLEVAEAKTVVRRVFDGFECLGFTFQARYLRP
jgi:hypothetical protein